MKVEAKSDSEDIRIYINDLLHLRIPRDKNLKLQSWIEENTKLFYIEIWCKGHQDLMAYEDRSIWEKVLKLFDEHL